MDKKYYNEYFPLSNSAKYENYGKRKLFYIFRKSIKNMQHFFKKNIKNLRNLIQNISNMIKHNTVSEIIEPKSNQPIFCFLVSIFLEKRMQYVNEFHLNIKLNYDFRANNLYSKIQPNEFKKILSDLIDYAINLIENTGTVSIEIKPYKNKIYISIISNISPCEKTHSKCVIKNEDSLNRISKNNIYIYDLNRAVKNWGGEIKCYPEFSNGLIIQLILKNYDFHI